MSLNKRAKMAEDSNAAAGGSALPGVDEADSVKMLAQLVTEDGDATGPQLELPHDITPKQLQLLVNKLLEQEDDEKLPYSFFVNEQEVTSSLDDVVKEQKLAAEAVVQIVYQAQAVFRVRAISQCSGTIPGHADNIVDVFFSPDGRWAPAAAWGPILQTGTSQPWPIRWAPHLPADLFTFARQLATGSGDMTVRLWDINTMTPQQTFKGAEGSLARVRRRGG